MDKSMKRFAMGLLSWALVSTASAQTFVDVTAASGAEVGGNKDGGASWGDLNNDGCLDILANSSSAGIYSQLLFQNTSMGGCAGTFANVTTTHAKVIDDETRQRPAVIGDFNGDGYNDFAIAHWLKLSIFLNQGPTATPAYSFGVGLAQTPHQEFTSWQGGDPAATTNIEGTSTVDFDADGDLDLVVESDQMGIRLLENDGAGLFTEVAISLSGLPGNDGTVANKGEYINAGDLDNDGNPDIVVRRNGPSALSKADLFWNNGASDDWFTPSTEIDEISTGANKGSVPFCDFNGDGLLDVLWTPGEVYTQGASRTFTKATLVGVSPSISGATCADFDNDGDVDLFLCGDSDAEHLYLNDGTGTLTELAGAGGIDLTGTSRSCIAADYNRDGSLDILVNRSGGNKLFSGSAPAAAASDYLVVTPTRTTGKLAEGATIRFEGCDGTGFGPRQIVGHGSATGAMAHTGALFGLGAGNAGDAVVVAVTFNGGTVVKNAVVPNTLGPYQEVTIGQSDADDTSACPSAAAADLGVTIADSPDPVAIGSSVSYAVTISNAGPDSATNTQVTLTLPAGLTSASTIGCTEDPNGVPTCTLGTITSGGNAMVTFTATASATGVQSVGASAAADEDDADGASKLEATTVVCADNDTGTTTDAGCSGPTPYCDASSGTPACVAGCSDTATGSNADTGCGAATPICDETGSNPSCVAAACIDDSGGATADTGCNVMMPYCYESGSSPVCVAGCVDNNSGTMTDAGCGGMLPYCDVSAMNPVCVAGCADTTSGGQDSQCPAGATDACDETAMNPTCVDCTETADCSVGNACNVATNSCVEGCFDDSDCWDAGATICDTSESSPGACVTCVNNQAGANPDEGCTSPALPVCNGASGEAGSACVFCLDDMSGGAMDTGCTMAGMALCDTSVAGGACVECLSDDDCPGLQVCTDDDACDYPDSDGDGFRDDVDVDDDGDGISDTEEGSGTDWSADQDGDGVPDYADPDEVTCTDAGPDGICDSLPTEVDADGDGLPNQLDLDADGDGLPDTSEGNDADGDGIADSVAVDNDADGDGLDDAFDPDCAGMPGACAADGIVAPVLDRDGDGAPDYLDADSDNDGLLDRVEGFDGDADGQPEALPSGVDADGDGLDDAFDVDQGGIAATGQDRDGDGLPDYLDQDSDGDGIADRVECGDPTACVDSDGDGAPDFLDTDSDDDGIVDAIEGHDGDGDGAPDFEPLGMDDDEDGLDDAYDIDMAGGVPATLPDHDGDSTPDYQDPDDDGDGVGSAFECPDVLAGCPDGDSDGVPDYLDPDSNPDDTDGDGIPDAVECEGNIAGCRDTDGDGSPDHMDPDDDDDGIPTAAECGSSPDLCDADGDGVPNHRDIDSDGDGITDSAECGSGSSCEDTDRDGSPDYLDEDADGDGIADLVEGHDADVNGIADRTPLNSDTDGDGLDDAFDADDGGTTAPTQDTDGDAVPDFQDADDDDDGIDTVFECADPGAGCPDGDADTTPDYLDADTTVIDTDGDGIPDVVECPPPGDPVGCPDTDGDGNRNFNDPDDDDDGIDTADENYDGDNDPTNEDSDGDGTPDYLDTDDDDDGVPTVNECADFVAGCADSDGDGRPDYLDVCGDDTVSVIDLASGWEECDDGNAIDGDGCDSSCRRESDVPDSDGDGIPNDVECPAPGSPMQPATCPDTDGDGTPDFDDEDDDGDGIDTADESPDGDSDPTDDDTDGDGTPNYLDEDDDGDGIDTADEIAASDVVDNDDLDGDGVLNWLDTDSDGDGIDDGDEVEDSDGNGVPDYLEDLADPSSPGRLILQGGRGVGCHVGVPGEGGPNGVLLLLLLGFGLGIRRYRRN